ncbi:MAG: Maf family protein [Treponema sp.]|jgi:septum formation protein|nr:Maf family protein [Treponema sp.]
MEPIILASGSLQRQEYFRLLGLPFNIMPPHSEENPGDFGSPKEAAENLAAGKVKEVIETLKGRASGWIFGADTIIVSEGVIFGKPKHREDAGKMLTGFRGRTHEVVTGMALYNGKTETIDRRSVVSEVSFADISEAEIEWYLNSGEWQGAAGAYKIQGLASCFISGIRGSPSSVVGLPIHEFYVMLRDNGYSYGG